MPDGRRPLDPWTYNWLNQGSSNLFPGNPPFPGGQFPEFGRLFGQDSTAGNIIQTMLPSLMEMVRQQTGAFGYTMGGQQSLYDIADSRDYYRRVQLAREAAVPQDVNRLENLFRGIAQTAGYDIADPGITSGLRRGAERGGQMLPYLATAFPELIDASMGTMGSGVVAAENWARAGRFMVQGGRAGDMDPAAMNAMMNAANAQMYRPETPGGPASTRRMYGLGAGQSSAALVELGNRGAIGGFSGTPENMGRQAAQQLEGYAASIAIVRDIFGDVGDANAPMAKIIRGIDQITRGGIGVYDPGRLANMVGQFRVAARISPMGYQGLAQFQELGGQLAEQYGLTVPGAMGTAWQTAFLSTQAFQGLYAGVASPEFLNKEQTAAQRLQLQAAGEASQFGNMIGAISAVARTAKPGSEFAQLAEGLRAGKRTMEINGKTVDIATMQMNEIEQMAQRSGIAPGILQEHLQFTRTNQAEFVREAGLGRVTPQAQAAELEAGLMMSLAGRPIGAGGGAAGGEELQRIATAVARATGKRTFMRGGQEVKIQGVADIAEAAAIELGRGDDATFRQHISNAVQQVGQGALGDSFAYAQRQRAVGPEALAGEEAARGQMEAENWRQLSTIYEKRGGYAKNLVDYLTELGKGNRPDPNKYNIRAEDLPNFTGPPKPGETLLGQSARLIQEALGEFTEAEKKEREQMGPPGINAPTGTRGRRQVSDPNFVGPPGPDGLGGGAAGGSTMVEIDPKTVVRIVLEEPGNPIRRNGTATFPGTG